MEGTLEIKTQVTKKIKPSNGWKTRKKQCAAMQNHKTGRNKPKTQRISCAFSSHAHPKRVQKKKAERARHFARD